VKKNYLEFFFLVTWVKHGSGDSYIRHQMLTNKNYRAVFLKCTAFIRSSAVTNSYLNEKNQAAF
jgi:hypothetical protein